MNPSPKTTASLFSIQEQDSYTRDIKNFLSAWEKAPEKNAPYSHYIVENLFEPSLIHQVLNIPFKAHELNYIIGSREEFNPFRQYFNPEAIEKYVSAKRIVDTFLSPQTIKSIEKKGNVSLKDSLLRIEYAIDTDKFWLKPHTDIGVKLFTMLLYLSEEAEAENWGTDIYYDADTHYRTVPYKSNTALCFFPSNKTWHGFEPRKIKGIRKTLIINYVTQEWRNRQELTHPTKPVY